MNNIEGIENNPIRKRLMYITQEDFYFLTYNLILILKEFGCTKQEKAFVDIRKIAYMIDFSSDSYLLFKVNPEAFDPQKKLKKEDRILLSQVYAKGRSRLPFINRLIYSLEKKEIIKIAPDPEKHRTNIYLCNNDLIKNFLKTENFNNEIQNVRSIKQYYPRMRTNSLDNLLENFYRKRGIVTCLD